jgi:glycosyltransferase involved in cell wall biosynthesis
MKVIYYSSPPFADADFPLIREYQLKGVEVYYFIKLPPYFLRSTLIDINSQLKKQGIYKASVYKEFLKFEDYINLDQVYILNQPHKSVFHWTSILLNIKVLLFSIKIQPDIFHCTNVLDNFDLLLYWFQKKMVITIHDPFFHYGENNFRELFFRKIAFLVVKKYILLSKSQKKSFINFNKIKEKNILVNKLGVYNFLEIFRNKYNSEENTILFIGRISPYKGIEYLLEAFEKAQSKFCDYKLVIAGGGDYYFDITKYVNNKNIIFINHYVGIEELTELMELCKFIVCPYIDATQSGVVMTAFALNKPVIATNVGSLTETVLDGETGLVVASKNSKAIEIAMIRLITDKQLLNNISNNIKDIYLKKENTWSEIANINLQFYKE